jgi:hypothetical protein
VLQCFGSSNADVCFVIVLIVIVSTVSGVAIIVATFIGNVRVSIPMLPDIEYISVYFYTVRKLYA